MSLAPPLPARLRLAVLGPRVRRVLGWGAAAVLLVGAGTALAAYSAAHVEPSTATRALVSGAAVLAAALAYALLAPRRAADGLLAPPPDPIALLWSRFLLVLGLLIAVEVTPLVFGTGKADAARHLPADLRTALAAVTVTALHAAVAVALLRGLQPLVMARPTRTATWLWRAFLGFIGVDIALRLVMPPGEMLPLLRTLPLVGAAVAMVGCAFRQGWILALPPRRRLMAGALAAALALALGFTLAQSFDGPGAVPVDGPMWGGRGARGDAYEVVPYIFLLSPALGDVVGLAFAFGVIYGLTATLTLLFSMPTSGAYQQRAGEVQAFRTLSALTLDPAKGLDRARLAQAVARAPVEAGLARTAWLALADPARGTLAPVVVAAEGLALEDAVRSADAAALAADAFGRGGPLVLAQAAADHRVRIRPGDGVGSLLVLPLAAGGQSHGALFATRASTGAFDAEETAALAAFAGQAALAFSHAQLFSEAVEKERMARELALAREVQHRLIPARLPAVPGASLAADIRSAQEVCGDYYDVAEVGGGCVGLLVADVSGKGAGAAFHMAQFQGVFQAAAALSRSPGAFLARANAALRPSLGPRVFISAVYAVLDTAAGTLTVARAGHCPALLARDGEVWPLRATGLGLGLDAGPLFRRTLAEQTVPLRPGDVLALYTDGLVEARNAEGEEFGYDRLGEALAATTAGDAPRDAAAIRDALLDAVAAFAGPEAAADDSTLVVLAWNGAPDAGGGAPPSEDGLPFSTHPAFHEDAAPADRARRPEPA